LGRVLERTEERPGARMPPAIIKEKQEERSMGLRKHAKKFAVAGVAAAVALASGTAMAQKRVKWKLHSAWGSNVPHLGTSGVRFTKTVAAMTENRFQIQFFEPGALIPANECFDAASKGSVESCWTTAGYDVGKYPALAFFTSVPFGPGYGEFFAWKKFGGGDDIVQEIYGNHGIVQRDCFAIGPETSGWFRKKIGSLDELKGMKMRFFGLGARVMQKIGVSTQLLAGGDIFPALEKGVIDATEFSMPAMDIKYGFYQVAKHNYFPGWHQQTSVSELLMNKGEYDQLPDYYKTLLDVACGDSIHNTYAETEAVNPGAMVEMGEKHGVMVERWSDEQLAVFEEAWNEVLEEDSAKDPLFKRVADSYANFRKAYSKWGAAQSLKPTYLN
jgi:TRAP-type mannitol/chloroaromatic compound transport system substrate-binding protein